MLVCDLAAIGPDLLGRYRELRARLGRAACERHETGTGFEWTIDETRISAAEVAEWMSLERRCCPFLVLELEIKGARCRLRLSGEEGIKAILEAEFSAAHAADAVVLDAAGGDDAAHLE